MDPLFDFDHILKTLHLEEDDHLQHLHNEMLKSRYRFLKAIMTRVHSRFIEETIDKNLDIDHIYYDLLFKEKRPSLTKEEEKELKKIYHDLCLRYHPDKNDNNASSFLRIQNLYERGDLESLRSFTMIDDQNEEEKELKKIESTTSFLYFFGNPFLQQVLREMFI